MASEVTAAIEVIMQRLRGTPFLAGFQIESTPVKIPGGITVLVRPVRDDYYQPMLRAGTAIECDVVYSFAGPSLTRNAEEIASIMDAAISGPFPVGVLGGTVHSVQRTRPIYYSATGEDGQMWHYLGGSYSVEVTG